jgi:N-acetylneuraminic acid mutarotase
MRLRLSRLWLYLVGWLSLLVPIGLVLAPAATTPAGASSQLATPPLARGSPTASRPEPRRNPSIGTGARGDVADSWAQLSPGVPHTGTGSSAVWDPTNGQLLIFGGGDGLTGPNLYLSDELWAYRPADTTWALLPSAAPGRFSHTAVWDPANAQMLVYGGYALGGGLRGDLWAYRPASNSWTELTTAGPMPTPRAGQSAVWDPADAQMLVFGGMGSSDATNELWSYRPASNAWSLLAPVGESPSARSGHTAVWDPVNNQMLVFGGNFSANDLWVYRPASNTWTQLTTSGVVPQGRGAHGAVWDPGNAQMLMFGGSTSGNLAHGEFDNKLYDLWAYRPTSGSWMQVMPAGAPTPQAGFGAAWDSTDAQLLIYVNRQLQAYRPATNLWSIVPVLEGISVWDTTNAQTIGFSDVSPNNLAAYRPATNNWVQLTVNGTPPPANQQSSAVWDATNAQMFIPICCAGRLWAYRPSTNSWTQLTPSGGAGPSGPNYGAVWDSTNAQLLLIGGQSAASTLLDDLWAYRPASNTWTRLTPTGQLPPFRSIPAAVWDPTNARLLVFGGGGGSPMNDLWAYAPGSNAWSQLMPSGGPPPARFGHSAVWDTVNSQMLIYGGSPGFGSHGLPALGDLWAYRPATNTWTQSGTTGLQPPPRALHSAVWDPVHAQMLIHAGVSFSTALSDLWAYRPGVLPPAPTFTPTATSTPTRTSTATATPYPRPNVGVAVTPPERERRVGGRVEWARRGVRGQQPVAGAPLHAAHQRHRRRTRVGHHQRAVCGTAAPGESTGEPHHHAASGGERSTRDGRGRGDRRVRRLAHAHRRRPGCLLRRVVARPVRRPGTAPPARQRRSRLD